MKITLTLIVLIFVSSCATTNHYSQAILLKKEAEDDSKKSHSLEYKHQGIGNNAIFVDELSTFRIEIDHIRPGWIHFDTQRAKLVEQKHKRISRDATEHIFGKELWLITRIESLSNEDVLEREGKIYYKTTNVKLNSDSFSILALDQKEKQIFTHNADTPYRITFRLYEVDGFKLKKAIANAYDNDPGITGFLKSGYDTVTSTLNTLAGPLLYDLWKIDDDKLLVERYLLQLDSTIEFEGEILVLREKGIFKKRLGDAKTEFSDNYLLYDAFKSSSNKTLPGFDENDIDGYGSLRSKVTTPIKLKENCAVVFQNKKKVTGTGVSSCLSSYIKLKVTQAYPPESVQYRDAIKKAAYDEGRKKGKIEGTSKPEKVIMEIKSKSYNNGYKKGKTDADMDIRKKLLLLAKHDVSTKIDQDFIKALFQDDDADTTSQLPFTDHGGKQSVTDTTKQPGIVDFSDWKFD